MATCCISQTGAIFVLLAISKLCLRFRRSLYRFQAKSSHHSSGTLGFPSLGQVQSFFVKSCICITYRIPHSIPCSHHVVWALHVVDCVPFAYCSCLGRARRRVRERGARWVRLRGSSQLWELCRQDDHTLESLLSLLARCSLFCYAYATMPTTCLSCLPNCHVKPLTHHVLANRCLAMLPLCSAPLIALLVAGEDWRSFLVGTLFIVGIS